MRRASRLDKALCGPVANHGFLDRIITPFALMGYEVIGSGRFAAAERDLARDPLPAC